MENKSEVPTENPTATIVEERTADVGANHSDEVSTVSFAAPKYEDDAALWFRQLEAKFEAARIRSQLSRYYIAFGNLPGVLLKPVVSTLAEPSATGRPYDSLREAILGREQLTAMERVNQVLRDINMGDRKPSDYFAYLKETAGNSFSEDAIFQIWLIRIPSNIKTTLIVLKNEPLKYRLEIADELFSAHRSEPQISAVEKAVPGIDYVQMKKEIVEEMRNMLKEALRASSRGRSQSRKREHNSRSRSKSKDHEYCWHHFKFGDKAHKCSDEKCKFKESQSKN